jgi:membrane-bound lytic murein transglycosylase A
MKMLSRCRRLVAAAILGAGAGCATVSDEGPPPVELRQATTTPASVATGTAIARARSRWLPADWAELPGWQGDATREIWPVLQRGCDKPAPGWEAICIAARGYLPTNDADARQWLQLRLRPYRVESPEGAREGLVTGYFEPLVEAQRQPRAPFRIPLYAAPDDLATRRPWWTRQQIDTLPAAQTALRGRELAWVADPLDALLLQVQGSGRLALAEPNGTRRLVRIAYAGHNDQPYKSVGRWLIDQGELRADQASWPAIRAWARANPKRLNELLWSNPRYVFFREEPLPDPALGPRGAQAVPLTPGRSIAVDPQSVPYGTPVWLDTTEPLSAAPLRRLVMAQDTGSAITGAVRADFFWGWGEEAEAQAGRMKQPLRMWALWPRQP